jgi:Fe-Mn family superoxide dismutase
MSPNRGGVPKGELADEINKAFGNLASFKEQFTNAALNRFGSGWAWLTLDRDGRLHVTSTANQDSPLMQGRRPILGLDVWEHAYYLKYQNRRPDYVTAWWNVVNWDAVSQFFTEAKQHKMDKVLA